AILSPSSGVPAWSFTLISANSAAASGAFLMASTTGSVFFFAAGFADSADSTFAGSEGSLTEASSVVMPLAKNPTTRSAPIINSCFLRDCFSNQFNSFFMRNHPFSGFLDFARRSRVLPFYEARPSSEDVPFHKYLKFGLVPLHKSVSILRKLSYLLVPKFFSIICSRPTTSLYAFSPFSADTRFSWGSDASSGRGRPTYRATRPGRDGPLGRVVPVPCALSISPRLTLLYLKKSARLTAGALAA